MLFEIVIVLLVILFLHVYCRLTCGRTESVACLVGKTALVTGGNDGIGFEVCLNFASRGCRVIIADKDDSEASRRKIIETTGNPNVISKKFDLASFDSVRKLAKEINETEERLDILVNNAGAGHLPEVVTEDGINLLLQVNHFGGFLLTHLLIRLLKKSAPSRIIFTSSPSIFTTYIDLEKLLRTKFSNFTVPNVSIYGGTKLAAVVISEVFAEKLRNTEVTVNSVSPGWVRTAIWEKSKLSLTWASRLVIRGAVIWCYVIGKSAWEGAQTTIHVAVDGDLKNVSGRLFSDCRAIAAPPQARGELNWPPLSWLGMKCEDKKESFGERIWRISEERCKLQPKNLV